MHQARMKTVSRTLITVLGALCLALPTFAQADDGDFEPGSTHPTLDTGVLFGGDKLVTENYIIGGHSTVYAGKGLFVDVGMLHNLQDSAWSFKGTAGVYTGFATGYYSATFTRYPLDLIALYNQGRYHFGFGLTYHANPKLDQNDHGPNEVFHDAVGGVLEIQYRVFGFRYTNIRYKVTGPCLGSCSYDGSTLGLFVNFVF
jgi:hypothetical protein